MKKIMMSVVCVCILILILIGCILITNTSISYSKNRDYSVAIVCIDIGGAGYLGDFYFIDRSSNIPRIYNTYCSTPGNVVWLTDNEFEIINRSGEHHFVFKENKLYEANK